MDSQVTVRSYNRLRINELLIKSNPYLIDYDIAIKYQKFNYAPFGLIDRTGGMRHFLNTSTEHKIPDYNPTYNKKFSQVCIEKAKEIVSKNKEIYIFWSGGLDSTTIISSFMSIDCNPNQVVICFTPDSIMESGILYEQIIKKQYKRYIFENPPVEHIWKKIPKDCLIVHGMNGNLIMGTEPYHLQPFMYDFPYEQHVYSDLIEFYMPAIEKYPKKIITLKDFWNFHSFNFMWNGNYYHFYRGLDYVERLTNFFGDDSFQHWHISSPEYGNGKKPMKKFIREIMGPKSSDYVNTKQIRFSFIRDEPDWCMYTSDNRTITTKDI